MTRRSALYRTSLSRNRNQRYCEAPMKPDNAHRQFALSLSFSRGDPLYLAITAAGASILPNHKVVGNPALSARPFARIGGTGECDIVYIQSHRMFLTWHRRHGNIIAHEKITSSQKLLMVITVSTVIPTAHHHSRHSASLRPAISS